MATIEPTQAMQADNAVAVSADSKTIPAVQLPQHPVRYLRCSQIVGDPKKNIPAIVPVCRSTWLRGVKDGVLPAGIKLSKGVTVWRYEDVIAVVEAAGK